MALLMVLGVLAASLVMIAHLMFFTQVFTKESFGVSRQSSLRYQAESAAETAFWLHLTDRRLFSNRAIGQTADDALRADADFPPWMLDGRPHEFEQELCTVYLASGETGTQATNLAALKTGLDASNDADLITDIDAFIDCYNDYVDTDDLRRNEGYERDDYANDGYETLPRNGRIEYRAELYWLPNWEAVLRDPLCIVPPRGFNYTFSTSRPDFYSASDAQLALYLGLDEDSREVALLREAIDAWNNDGVPVEDSLDLTLLTQAKARFNFNEATVALVAAVAQDPGREISTELRTTRVARFGATGFFADSRKECLSIWERVRE